MGEKRRRLAAAGAAGSKEASAGKLGGGEQEARELAHQARLLAAQGSFGPALDALARAIEAAPERNASWAQFGELIRVFRLRHPFPDALRALLARALEHPAVDPASLMLPIVSAALSRPGGDALAEPLLLRLMEDAVVRDARIETLVAAARRRALEGTALPLPLLAAIAHQCFNTEYVMAEGEDEAARLPPPQRLEDYALYAAYRPLRTLPEPLQVAERLAATPLASLARRQILEPLEEDRLRAEIATLAIVETETAGSDVSQAVQAQYEANPYPRWLRTQTRFEAAPLGELVREMFPDARVANTGPARILLAGCGTGQNAIATALRVAGASMLAVDLSRSSLAYARRKTEELGVANIEYRHADLLALGSLPERFDLVEASGVLHHLADPLAGWRVLAGLVRPGGFMRIGLYSARGRRHFSHARQWLAGRGIEPTPAGIRAAREAIRAAAPQDELLARVARNEDFFSLSGCRDMLFHVQEQAYELPQVAAMIEALGGFGFLGFEFDDSGITAARYRARFASDPMMRNLDTWHAYEQDNPDAFSRMYEFWLQRAQLPR